MDVKANGYQEYKIFINILEDLHADRDERVLYSALAFFAFKEL